MNESKSIKFKRMLNIKQEKTSALSCLNELLSNKKKKEIIKNKEKVTIKCTSNNMISVYKID